MNILEFTNDYGNRFLDSFVKKGYTLYRGVNVSSKIDPSVYLIGSTISVFKPFLINESDIIPKCVITQKAIRTQALKNMESGIVSSSRYGSYFIAMGTLAPYSSLEETTNIALGYLQSIMPNKKQLKIRINSEDQDLIAACLQYLSNTEKLIFEFDSMPLKYYQHHYGMDELGITGRNCNIAIEIQFSEWLDVANIIVIEKNGHPIAVEFAIGMSTLIANAFGFSHTMNGNIIADILPMKEMKDYWIGDCVSVITCLIKEGVVPNSSKMQGRLLKKYIRVLSQLCEEKQIDMIELIEKYESYLINLQLPL